MNTDCSSDHTVWLVDDDPDDQLLIQTAFNSHVPPVLLRILTDGGEVLPALETARSEPKLILMDINMTRQNGFDTLQRLRASWAWQHLPVIIFSTSDNKHDRAKALELGATQFLTKPTSYKQLQALVGQLVSGWQLGISESWVKQD